MAAKKMFRTEDFKTPIARLSFAQDLFKPRENDRGTLKYGCTLIFPKTVMQEKVIKKADGSAVSFEGILREAIIGEWGERGLERAKSGLIHNPFLAGDGPQARNKETGELHPGMGPEFFFIRPTANGDRAPKISSTNTQFIPATPEEVYSGCYGYAVLNAFTWNDPKKGDGISFGIQMFFKTGDGDRLGGSGGGNPDKWTESVPDAGEAPASTKSGAGAGGLFGD